MLLDLPTLWHKYDMGRSVTGVLHCGAHLGEEAQTYADLGISDVWWVEANPDVWPKLRRHLAPYGHHLIHALLAERDGDLLDFHVTNYDGMSSSILEFGTHPTFSPDTKFVKHMKLVSSTIDTIVTKHQVKANFLNMDLQGAELRVLAGAMDFIEDVDYIMTEVNKAEVYVGCAKIDQLDSFLFDFDRVETTWVPGQGWGDALYIRKDF